MSRYDSGVDASLIALVLTVGAGVVGFVVHSWFGADASRTRRVLRRTRTTRIADLSDGKLACIVGRVERIVGPGVVTSVTGSPPSWRSSASPT